LISNRFVFSAAIAVLISLGFSSSIVSAKDYKKTESLVATSKTIIGETLVYPKGEAEVDGLVVVMQPGETTGWHKHGVPLFAYILEGQVTVDYGDKGKRTYKPGDSFMEAMDHWHNGTNDGSSPTRILAVFMSAKGAAKVIRKQEPAGKK